MAIQSKEEFLARVDVLLSEYVAASDLSTARAKFAGIMAQVDGDLEPVDVLVTEGVTAELARVRELAAEHATNAKAALAENAQLRAELDETRTLLEAATQPRSDPPQEKSLEDGPAKVAEAETPQQ